jgi:hypothetical protein
MKQKYSPMEEVEMQLMLADKISRLVIHTSSAGGDGSVSVNYGAEQDFTISPDAQYHVAHVLVDDSSVGEETSYTLYSVTAARTISANRYSLRSKRQ